MNTLLLCSLITTIASSTYCINDEKFAIATFTTECVHETGISIDLLGSLARKEPPHYLPVYQKFMLCLLQKMGVLDEDGRFSNNIERMRWLPRDKAQIRLEMASRVCGEEEGITPADTASRIFKCFIYNGV